MSVPNHIFIDTSIFDSAGFNFESSKMKLFRDKLDELELTFLDPDPIFRERERHLRERVDKATQSLRRIEKSLPVITSLHQWPRASFFRSHNIHKLLSESLSNFLKPMKYIKLDYDGINMHMVMNWYEQGRAPFGAGGKRKEFPDALAVAMLDRYAQKSRCEIAVVSTDSDFERACSERPNLLYFPSLAAYLQSLQGESKRVNIIQNWFEESEGEFDDWISEALSDIDFVIEEGWTGDLEDPELYEVNILEFYIIAVADRECTVSFEAEINFSIQATYVDENDYEYPPDMGRFADPYDWEYRHPQVTRRIDSTAYSSTLAKIRLNDSKTRVEAITYLELEVESISVPVMTPTTYI